MSDDFEHANATRITDRLWVGGDLRTDEPDAARRQLDELVAAGLTDLVDLRLEWDDTDWVAAERPDLGYLWLGVDDAGQRMPDEWFEEGTAYALERIGAGGTVLAHCHMGINRGPSLGFAVLLAQGMDAVPALELIGSRRPIAYVAYAEDALDWWLRGQGVGRRERREARAQVEQWRRDNDLDLHAVIRRVRES